jgi:hypothetical protein
MFLIQDSWTATDPNFDPSDELPPDEPAESLVLHAVISPAPPMANPAMAL